MLSCTCHNCTKVHACLADVLHARATETPEGIAYTFLVDGAANATSLTWAELDRRGRALGTRLCQEQASGAPVLILLPSGLEFVVSLFACWHAGAIPVPASLPRHPRMRYRLEAIIQDCGAQLAIGTVDARQTCATIEGEEGLGRVRWLDPAAQLDEPGEAPTAPPTEPVALIQYTSGSTGSPRGVVVTHANLIHNSALISAACAHRPGEVICGWLPLFHDMGLIGLIVQAATAAVRCVFMPTDRFLMRPWQWLQMISDYRACSSPAPNFAYDLCVERVTAQHKARLDLSSWRNALNGSEPVRAATLERFAEAFASCGFRRDAFFPCYGLAESTLFAAGPGIERILIRRSTNGQRMQESDPGGHVSCGRPFGDTRLAIVDPVDCTEVRAEGVGEIWLQGASVASGYWHQPEVTLQSFGGNLKAPGLPSAEPQGNEPGWLRTGDLGFVADGELFITGRLRELIIIAGRNHFPIDLERTVETLEPAITTAVTFGAEIDGMERLVVAVEMRRGYQDAPGNESVRHRIRAALAADHGVSPHDVAMLRPGGVLRTSSGKVRRQATRDAYLNRTLELLEISNHAACES